MKVILSSGTPLPTIYSLYAGELTRIWAARAYRNFSSLCARAITTGFLITPILMANSGHRSRTSSKKGLRRTRATNQAETAWKIGGVVPIIRSASLTRRVAQTELNIKLKNETARQK